MIVGWGKGQGAIIKYFRIGPKIVYQKLPKKCTEIDYVGRRGAWPGL